MCKYIRLSGGQHGFSQMCLVDARAAAEELGSVHEQTTYVKKHNYYYSDKHVRFSISFFNSDDCEVATYSVGMETLQLFDPPREKVPKW